MATGAVCHDPYTNRINKHGNLSCATKEDGPFFHTPTTSAENSARHKKEIGIIP